MISGGSLRLVAVTLLLWAAPTVAQDPLVLERGPSGPRILARGLLDDDALENVVRSGLPLRMRFRVELWRDGFVDDLVGQTTWAAVVAFEPLERRFLAGSASSDSLASFPSWAAARGAVEGPYAPAMRASAPGRYYYIGKVEVETLSLSDLDELERWLRGELEPAVRGNRSVGGALGTGLKRLLIRILGLPARRHEVRNAPFVIQQRSAAAGLRHHDPIC